MMVSTTDDGESDLLCGTIFNEGDAIAITPFPDETLYSLLCRANRLRSHQIPPRTSGQIFGFEHASLFNPVPVVSGQRLSKFGFLDNKGVWSLIKKTTFLNLYSVWFHPEHSGTPDESAMLNISRIMNVNLADFKASRGQYAFCEQCVNEDLGTMGLAYWRLSHQFPGVTLCHAHGSRLMSHQYLGPRRKWKPTMQLPNEHPSDGRYSIEPICEGALYRDTQWVAEKLAVFVNRLTHWNISATNRLFDFLVLALSERAPRKQRYQRYYYQSIEMYTNALLALGINLLENPVSRILRYGHQDVQVLKVDRVELCVAFLLALTFLFEDYQLFEEEYAEFERVAVFLTPI